MEKQTSSAVWIITALVVGVLLTVLAMPTKTETVVSPVTCPSLPAITCPNPVVSDVDTAWKEEAVNMATLEWSEKGYKAIFEALNDIDEKEDIASVVVKYVKVEGSDSFSKDATVIQELKVYYEDDSGDDVKEYLTVETLISDGDLDEQDIDLS